MRNKLIAAMAALAILMSACSVDPSTNFESISESEVSPNTSLDWRAGFFTFVEEDITMLANTGSSSITITNVEIWDTNEVLVLSYAGCNRQSCTIDLSTLSPGNYQIIAHASDNGSFSDHFSIGS